MDSVTTVCPTCGGARLYNWVYRHLDGCSVHAAEDATQGADHERMRMLGWPYSRPATSAEVTLLTAAGTVVEDGEHVVTVVSWNGYRERVIGGVSGPDLYV